MLYKKSGSGLAWFNQVFGNTAIKEFVEGKIYYTHIIIMLENEKVEATFPY